MARRQDRALTVDQLIVIRAIADKDWVKSNSKEEKKELESTIEFATIYVCVSLLGEEVTLMVIKGLIMFWKDTRNHCILHTMMALKERFKGKTTCSGIVFCWN